MKNVFWVKIVDEIIGIYLYCNSYYWFFGYLYVWFDMNYVINVIWLFDCKLIDLVLIYVMNMFFVNICVF